MPLKPESKISIAAIITLWSLFGCSGQAESPLKSPLKTPANSGLRHDNRQLIAFAETSDEFAKFLRDLEQKGRAEKIAALKEFRTRLLGSPAEKQLSDYLLARQLQASSDRADLEEALSLFEEAASHEDLGERARLHGAEIALSLNNEKKLQEILEPIRAAAEKSAAEKAAASKSKSPSAVLSSETAARIKTRSEAVYRLAESYNRAESYRQAIDTFILLRRAYPKTEFATGAAQYLGTLAIDQDNNPERALDYFRIYLKASPQGKFAPSIGQRLLKLETPPQPDGTKTTPPISLTRDDHLLIAYAFYRHGLWSLALDQWDRAGSKHILRSLCLVKLNKKAEGIQTLIAAGKANYKDPLIKNVATQICHSLSTAEALSLWKQVQALAVPGQDEVLWNIARRSGNAAPPYYQQIVSKFPKSVYAPESLWWLLWDHAEKGYRLKGKPGSVHIGRAAAYAAQGLKSYPTSDSAPRYAFWLGKLQERLGNESVAVELYAQTAKQFAGSYYGYRSSHRLAHLKSLASARALKKAGKKPGTIVPDRLWSMRRRHTPDPNWTWPEPPKFFRYESLPAAIGPCPAVLAYIGEYDEALSLLPPISPVNFKSWICRKAGQTMRAIGTASYKLDGAPGKDLRWQFAYPLAYAADVDREANKQGLDPLLVHGLIRQESRYDTKALSRSKAMGLMQLLVGTAYGTAKHNNITLASKEQIFEPATNISLGCSYLAYVLKRHNGNPMLAVASYNGGPNAVKKWMNQHQAAGHGDLDVYVESIPYKETRGYVRKVFNNYWNYESIYN